MNKIKEYTIVLADYDWTPTEHIVAEAVLLPNGDVTFTAFDENSVEEIEGLKSAIKNRETRFQANGCFDKDAVPNHMKYLFNPPKPQNNWKYIITEK